MRTLPAILATLLLAGLLAACGGGSDGSGLVSRPEYAETLVLDGYGVSEDVRYNPIGTLYVEAVGSEYFLLERAVVGTIVLAPPDGGQGGGNQINFGAAANVGRVEIQTSDNVLYLGPGADAGQVTIYGNGNTIYLEQAATLDLDDQGANNAVVGL